MNPPPLPPPLPAPSPSAPSQLTAILRLAALAFVGSVVVIYLNWNLLAQSAGNIFRHYLVSSRSASHRRLTPDNAHRGDDAVQREIMAYRASTRLAYNARRFDELERLADDARSTQSCFGNGGWKIVQFYGALACANSEPESMWQLHDSIHQAWIAARPDSITARVARIEFLVDYAWQARGNGYANTITTEGGRIFEERLAAAHRALDESKTLGVAAPDWWSAGMGIALGEGWSREDYDGFYTQAKSRFPTFWGYDTRRSNYLATKWYGQSGDWETAATEASNDPRGLGLEVYARCVFMQTGNYGNVFRESNANWGRVRDGCELLRQRYPDSMELASAYCRLACLAADRPTAKKLFALLGDNAFSDDWVNVENLRRDRAWANSSS